MAVSVSTPTSKSLWSVFSFLDTEPKMRKVFIPNSLVIRVLFFCIVER